MVEEEACEKEGADTVICQSVPEICPEWQVPPTVDSLNPKIPDLPDYPCSFGQWESQHMTGLLEKRILVDLQGNPLLDTNGEPQEEAFDLPVSPYSSTDSGCNDEPICMPPENWRTNKWDGGESPPNDRGCADKGLWTPIDTTYLTDGLWTEPTDATVTSWVGNGVSGGDWQDGSWQFASDAMRDYAQSYGVQAIYGVQGITVDGCANRGDVVPTSALRATDDLAAVRCCSDEAPLCKSQVGDSGCNSDVTFRDAQLLCHHIGMRLCKDGAEMDQKCCGVEEEACGFDSVAVWISEGSTTPAPSPGSQENCCSEYKKECLACVADQSVADYCTDNPGAADCDGETPEGVCCTADHADCLSCQAGQTKDDYCSTHNDKWGCPGGTMVGHMPKQ